MPEIHTQPGPPGGQWQPLETRHGRNARTGEHAVVVRQAGTVIAIYTPNQARALARDLHEAADTAENAAESE